MKNVKVACARVHFRENHQGSISRPRPPQKSGPERPIRTPPPRKSNIRSRRPGNDTPGDVIEQTFDRSGPGPGSAPEARPPPLDRKKRRPEARRPSGPPRREETTTGPPWPRLDRISRHHHKPRKRPPCAAAPPGMTNHRNPQKLRTSPGNAAHAAKIRQAPYTSNI